MISKNVLLAGVVSAEAVLCLAIIWKVKYTEIDWKAYMQEVGGFLLGELDYAKLSGDTGPLVYPAGFVYIFSFLSKITSGGSDVRFAQYIFALLSVMTTLVVAMLYRTSKIVPFAVMAVTLFSKRMHSIYVLRLFNDPFAMLFLYLCVLSMCKGRWTLAAVLYSLAVSVKMNILLFAPGFALLTFEAVGWNTSVRNAIVAASIQAVLTTIYLGLFEFSRVFLYKWTVNWRFVPENVFLGKPFASLLLYFHGLTLVYFIVFKWCKPGFFTYLLKGFEKTTPSKVDPDRIFLLMFVSNFVGIVFARSLHYQFYSWYFHMLPYLLWRTHVPIIGKIALFGAIEYCWNVYPSTNESSILLLVSHGILLLGLLVGDEEPKSPKKKSS
ncbi:lethal(2)neighbour of Tid protein-like protein [Chytridium lagenaria]|nr:lethal(2)neighbour of Tid protein-like protein [Chytridium lagenaria]